MLGIFNRDGGQMGAAAHAKMIRGPARAGIARFTISPRLRDRVWFGRRVQLVWIFNFGGSPGSTNCVLCAVRTYPAFHTRHPPPAAVRLCGNLSYVEGPPFAAFRRGTKGFLSASGARPCADAGRAGAVEVAAIQTPVDVLPRRTKRHAGRLCPLRQRKRPA